MNYVVVVLDPVPEDLGGAAAVVAEGFRIPADRALALLKRAPGPVTREVPERQARNVAQILSKAGLTVEMREGDANGRSVDWRSQDDAGRVTDGGVSPLVTGGAAHAESAVETVPLTVTDPATRRTGESVRASGVYEATDTDSGYRPARSVRSAVTFEEPEVREAERSRDPYTSSSPSTQDSAYASSVQTETEVRDTRSSEPNVRATYAQGGAAPVPGHTVPQAPRDPMKTTLTHEPPQLDRRSLRRRIATAATLPAVLTLLVMLLALSVTLLPVLRVEQARRAGEIATSVAATIEGMAGGLPLSAPLVRLELQRVESASHIALAGRGMSFMAVLDVDGSPLAGWEATGPGGSALSEDSERLARARAADARGVDVTVEPWLESLKASWQGVLAIVGLAEEPLVAAAAPVRRGDVRLGTVVVAQDPSGLRSSLGQVLLTTLLVGLIPVLFSILAALSLTRGLTNAISYLLVAADRISHGEFEQPVELNRDDELGQIAGAIDRMRISLREGMERLRRRR